MVGTLHQVTFLSIAAFTQDGLTLSILRGFRGVGGAVAMPSTFDSMINGIHYLCDGCCCRWYIWRDHRSHWRSVFYAAAVTSALTGASLMLIFPHWNLSNVWTDRCIACHNWDIALLILQVNTIPVSGVKVGTNH
ncbi:hypothetical protein BDR07DRAFT_919680 [Suillus spraguei]|nr:hypothetical protein BDR07DRAFT_919680 [Suillus spraguei]